MTKANGAGRRLSALALGFAVALGCAGLAGGAAWAGERPAPVLLSAGGPALAAGRPGLQMIATTSPPADAEAPNQSTAERRRQVMLYQAVGIAAATSAAAILGAALAGPYYGMAAGTAVLITYFILP